MKYSYSWLQKHIEEKLPKPEALRDVIHTKAFEVESIEEKGGNSIFDIAVLPDRAHDCLSHYGMAREIAGLCGLTLKPYSTPKLSAAPLDTKVEIQSDLCRRYIAIKIEGVKVGDSPEWLREALESVGARSINNIVDATNYVLFDRGQPVHAFDTTKVDGGIVVRMAREGEKIITLSNEEKELKNTDLVIADYLGALAIAGVKGGMSAEVREETTSIIIEVANFDPTIVRKTARRLALQTDASKRFENELSPEVAYEAACAAATLIVEVAGGTIVGVSDTYPKPQEKRTVSFSVSDISRILGGWVTGRDIAQVFDLFHYENTFTDGVLTLTVPHERYDLVGPEDIAEEVGRVLGYERIAPASLPFTLQTQPSEYEKVRAVKWWLARNGFREVMNYTFTKKGDVYVSYGPKDKSALRTDLSLGLKESYEKNRLNAALLGLEKIRLFEIGAVFSTEKEEIRVATADAGVFEELLLDEFIKKYNIDSSDIPKNVTTSGVFKEWSPYPFIVRDVAVWCDSSEDQGKLEGIVSDFAKEHCVREPVLFDRFEKDGKASVAYRFVFQSYEKTLTEEEVEGRFSELVSKIKKNTGFEVR